MAGADRPSQKDGGRKRAESERRRSWELAEEQRCAGRACKGWAERAAAAQAGCGSRAGGAVAVAGGAPGAHGGGGQGRQLPLRLYCSPAAPRRTVATAHCQGGAARGRRVHSWAPTGLPPLPHQRPKLRGLGAEPCRGENWGLARRSRLEEH
eukprot:458048-Rhodomonas_salina.2